MSKYNITDPSFGVWNETDEVLDTKAGTISDGYCNSSTDKNRLEQSRNKEINQSC